MDDGGDFLESEKLSGRCERLGDIGSIDDVNIEVTDWLRHDVTPKSTQLLIPYRFYSVRFPQQFVLVPREEQ